MKPARPCPARYVLRTSGSVNGLAEARVIGHGGQAR